jgi:hypothetical protein
MNKRNLIAAAFAAFIGLSLAVNAADEAKKKGPSFKDMAGSKDHITLADMKKAMTGGKMDDAAIEKRFAALDANGDKKVTQEEWSAGQKKKEKKN